MGKKAAKATRKFAASGQLKKTIQTRRKQRDIRKKAEKRKAGKGRGKELPQDKPEDDVSDDEGQTQSKGMSVDDFLGGGFMEGEEDEQEDAPMSDVSEGESDDEDIGDNESFASVDDLDGEGRTHMLELSTLAEKDPEFFKYLQENDRELLQFDPDGAENDVEFEEDVDEELPPEAKAPVLTKEILRRWQKALLEQRSLRALRRLLIAFRSAAHMNEEDQDLAWTIDSPSIYNKLVVTTLRYTPIILDHHCPCKATPNGKLKGPTQTPKWKTLQKLILSYFYNAVHLISQLSDTEMLRMAVSESSKLLPYVMGSRKAVKVYLKACLDLWSSAEDSVRIAAFLAIRKLASATDASIMDLVLKNTYLTLVRSCKSTSVHTLPSINLMKNSASELYCMDHAAAYQHAFGYIRQLAIHLRNSMKVKSKEAYKQVYNWQYVHCVDFWALVLARACDTQAQTERNGKESELKALIYPFVQVSLGAMKLIRNSRSFPFHFHIIRSILHLTEHTRTYVPLVPSLLPILTSTMSSSSKPKASTLRHFDFDTNIRAPNNISRHAYLLAEYLASGPVHASIAFPETVVPLVMMLRKAIKGAKASPWKAKEAGVAKVLAERIEESSKWAEQKRKGVAFTPSRMTEVEAWENSVKVYESPLGRYVKVQRKAREKRRKLVEKAREGADEILED
ncbi:Noc2-domain-containing protein [Fomitopsis serialis]|uniref:Noc2-domain-containing protein n=1 Tax=Fomitopsis serialis TaxID=139415 RepID=UPI0020072139|nr:Noc2-domain-containing protein [Neoantrodia serialis]KAH9929483.1 Noc2-domain-containing protein [Neoantrodia serialis]